MAQIIKHRRGSLEKLSEVTGSLQKGEIVIATGSANLTTTNGSALAFIVPESGSVQASNRFLMGSSDPAVFSASIYNGMVKGVPYYASGSKTLFLLGSDGNEAINLVGNIQPFSGSVNTRLGDLEASIGGGGSGIGTRVAALEASQSYFDGTFSGSVATQFSASAASQTALSASIATTDSASAAYAASQLSSLSSSVATSFSASAAGETALSASIATTNSASVAQITEVSASLSSVSASVATSLSASAATITANSASAATSISASNYNITSLSASVASVTGDFSSSVATSFSASAASVASLSASIATTDSASAAAVAALSTSVDSRLDSLEFNDTRFATTGSNIFIGNQVITGSMYITQDLIVYGSSSLFNVTASVLDIGDNTIVLNNATPAVRFGGISVQDSGSNAGISGSLFWDSLNNNWIYQHPNTGPEAGMSAMLISGPLNSGSLGDEVHITPGKIMVATGDDHIGDSIMSQSAGKITVEGGLDVTGNISSSTITGIGNVTLYSQSVDSRVATLETSLGGGGSIGTRVGNLETISASYLAFTQSYYTDSASFDTRISGSNYTISANSASAATSFSASVASQTSLSASIASDINTLSSSVATQFSASAAGETALSASIATQFSASAAGETALSASIATQFSASAAGETALSASIATTISASLSSQSGLSASVAADLNTLSASIYQTDATQSEAITNNSSSAATSFSASLANITSVSASLSSVSGAFATEFSASYALVSNNSASAASALSGLSSSVATSFSASAAGETALSSSLASRVSTLEGSGSIQSVGTANTVSFAELSTAGNVTVGGDLIVNGNTTSLNTANLYVEDKLITLASGSTSGTTSDGAGIEIAGTSASLKYVDASTSFSSSVNVIAPAVTASLNVPGGSSTKRVAFRNTNDNIDFVAAPTQSGDLVQWNGSDFVMSNVIDGGAF